MKNKNQINLSKVLSSKISRKQFFTHLGGGALAVIGITSLKSTVTNYAPFPVRKTGYGSLDYSGRVDDSASLFGKKKV